MKQTSLFHFNIIFLCTFCVRVAWRWPYILLENEVWWTPSTGFTYRVSQEECARLRKGVPYVKVYRYNPKHLCPKLNGYGVNGQRKVCSSGGSTHCTCQLTSLIDVCSWVWCPMTESQHALAVQLCSRLIPECAVSHVTSVLAIHVSCIVLGTLRTTMTFVRVFS